MVIDNNDFVDWLGQELKKRDWSYQELANRAGITRSAVSTVMTHRQGPGLEFCKGIARAFHLPPEVVLRTAGLLPPLPGDPNLDLTMQKMLDLFDKLDEIEQQQAMDYLEYLVDKHHPQPLGKPATTKTTI